MDLAAEPGADFFQSAADGVRLPGAPSVATEEYYGSIDGLNHIAVVTDDIDAPEAKVKAAGFEPRSHADYEPGRRFYFDDQDGIEYEVVSYP